MLDSIHIESQSPIKLPTKSFDISSLMPSGGKRKVMSACSANFVNARSTLCFGILNSIGLSTETSLCTEATESTFSSRTDITQNSFGFTRCKIFYNPSLDDSVMDLGDKLSQKELSPTSILIMLSPLTKKLRCDREAPASQFHADNQY